VSTIKKVLLIGPPFLYELVDVSLLRENNLTPIFLYEDKSTSINAQCCAYVDRLCVNEVKGLAKKHEVSFIVCFNDNFLIDAAKIRTELNLQGMHSVEIERYKKKSLMCNLLKHNLNTIPYLTVDKDTSYDDVVLLFGEGRYFIKPDYMAGSEGAGVVTSKKEFLTLQNEIIEKYKIGIIQPYIDTELFHCELMVKNGEVIYKNARKYSYPNFKILSGKIIASLPIKDEKIRLHIEDKACLVQKTLGFKNGLMHTEFFMENNQLLFLETNIRQAGGGINLIHKNRLDISMETAMILLETGKELKLGNINNKFFTSGYIPRQKGTVQKTIIPDMQGEVEFNIRVKSGDVLDIPKTASDASVSYIGEYNSLSKLYEDFVMLEKTDIIVYENKSMQ